MRRICPKGGFAKTVRRDEAKAVDLSPEFDGLGFPTVICDTYNILSISSITHVRIKY